MGMKDFIDFLKSEYACAKGIVFVESCAAPQEAWQKCTRSDFMIWYLCRVQYDSKMRVRITCRFIRETRLHDGRTVWDLLADKRTGTAVELAEKWANGEAIPYEDLLNAQRVAYDAPYTPADAAATYAAHPHDTIDATNYTVYAAVCAATTLATIHAIRRKARAQQADIIREMIPEIPLPELVTT